MANTVTINVQAEAQAGLGKVAGLLKQFAAQAMIPAAGAAAAFGVGLASAAAPLAALGAAMGPQISSVKELSQSYDKVQDAVRKYGKGSQQAAQAQKEYNQQLSEMSPETQKAAKSFQGLKNDFSKWSDSLSGTTMPIFTKGLNAMRTILPMLTPFVKDAAQQIGVFATKVEKGVKTDKFKAMMKDFQQFSSGALKAMISGISTLAKKAGELVQSEGFKNFLAQGKAEGPGIVKMFQDLAEVVGKFVVAAGPMGGLSLKVLETLAAALNAIPMDVLRILVPTILGAAAAIKILTAAQILLNIAMAANPIGLVLSALALLAAGFYLAWTKSEKFRTVILVGFDAIKIAASTAAVFVLKALKGLANAWLTVAGVILKGAKFAFGWIPGIGDKLKSADAAFGRLKAGVNAKFDSMIGKVQQFDRNAKNALKERMLKANISDWNSKLEAAKKRLRTVPAGKRATLRAEISDLERKVRRARGQIDAIHGKTVAINVRMNYSGKQSDLDKLMANGGPMSTAATGGPRTNQVLVGEMGPEIVNLPSGSFVNSASKTRNMMERAGSSTGRAIVEIRSSGNAVDNMLVEILKRAIRTRGGNVQTVLGT